MDSSYMEGLAAELSNNGVRVVRFEFEYMAERRLTGRKRPPQAQAKLLKQWSDHIDHWLTQTDRLFIGGKSLGGRMASLVAAERVDIRGCLCFGYPFHPPGRPERWRTDHFDQLKVPVWIGQGERDPFGKRDEVEAVAEHWKGNPELSWITAGDHDYKPTKASGLSQAENLAHAAREARRFIQSVSG
ncbi:dienelactone hydrolase family protein [Marinobacteraceae bacterium S3BR75-40.1]